MQWCKTWEQIAIRQAVFEERSLQIDPNATKNAIVLADKLLHALKAQHLLMIPPSTTIRLVVGKQLELTANLGQIPLEPLH